MTLFKKSIILESAFIQKLSTHMCLSNIGVLTRKKLTRFNFPNGFHIIYTGSLPIQMILQQSLTARVTDHKAGIVCCRR